MCQTPNILIIHPIWPSPTLEEDATPWDPLAINLHMHIFNTADRKEASSQPSCYWNFLYHNWCYFKSTHTIHGFQACPFKFRTHSKQHYQVLANQALWKVSLQHDFSISLALRRDTPTNRNVKKVSLTMCSVEKLFLYYGATKQGVMLQLKFQAIWSEHGELRRVLIGSESE